MMEAIRLTNGNIVTSNRIAKRDIILRNGTICLDINNISYDRTVDITGKYVVRHTFTTLKEQILLSHTQQTCWHTFI